MSLVGGVGVGEASPGWEPLMIKEPLVTKVSFKTNGKWIFNLVEYRLVCSQRMKINAYCALEPDKSVFFLACVAWDKLSSLSESQFACLPKIEYLLCMYSSLLKHKWAIHWKTSSVMPGKYQACIKYLCSPSSSPHPACYSSHDPFPTPHTPCPSAWDKHNQHICLVDSFLFFFPWHK